jgi:hypothetical protein
MLHTEILFPKLAIIHNDYKIGTHVEHLNQLNLQIRKNFICYDLDFLYIISKHHS